MSKDIMGGVLYPVIERNVFFILLNNIISV